MKTSREGYLQKFYFSEHSMSAACTTSDTQTSPTTPTNTQTTPTTPTSSAQPGKARPIETLSPKGKSSLKMHDHVGCGTVTAI